MDLQTVGSALELGWSLFPSPAVYGWDAGAEEALSFSQRLPSGGRKDGVAGSGPLEGADEKEKKGGGTRPQP